MAIDGLDVAPLAGGGAAGRETVLAQVGEALLDEGGPRVDANDLVRQLLPLTEHASVFVRSFAAECLAVCAAADARTHVLGDETWAALVDAVTDAAARETDLRGYVDGEGWAHAAAHLADALGELAAGPRATRETCLRALDGLCALIAHAERPFDGEEDERLAVALLAILDPGGIPVSEVRSRVVRAVGTPAEEETPAQRAVRVNAKHVLSAAARRSGSAELAEAAGALARP